MMRHLVVLLLVSMSLASCPEDQFQCIEKQDCVSLEQVCDFHSDCSDGSDEEFCGSCDFDNHTCGWIDNSNDDRFQWRREMANVSSNPGSDHTTGSPWGGVMHVGGDGHIFSKAILEHTLIQATALGCRISFWFHLHDASIAPSVVDLNVVTITSTIQLWSIKKDQTNGWEKVSLLMGNFANSSKLVFSASPTYIGSQDIMLDDVKFTDCGEGDVPEASDQLTCDFENDTCSWYHDNLAEITWKRANGKKPSMDNQGPEHDHTTGSGYYLFISLQSSSKPLTARMISFPQKSKCVSFWYLIYGGNIGLLRFIVKQANGTQTVIWQRTGTQGNTWRFADLSFADSEEPFQFIFEGIVEGKKGSIAIDDVMVSSSIDGLCPAERECTFQSSLCGLMPDPTTSYSWVRFSGELAGGTPSPSTDHTLGTDQGFYLSAQLWKKPSGSRTSIMSDIYQPTSEHGECLTFWYYMTGGDLDHLNIRIQETNNIASPTLVLSMSGNQGDEWRHGRATIISPHSPYKIIFEAVAGNGNDNDIAIDDLTMLNDPCPPPGFCDFEMDLCGWVNRYVNHSSVEWSWTSGISADSYSPKVDHTTNTAMGHYVAFDYNDMKEQIGHFVSETMEPVPHGCLEFWYHMHIGFFDDLKLTVYVNESGSLHHLWTIIGDQKNVWHEAILDYNSSVRHQIVFEAKRHLFDSGVIALDDVHIRVTSCSGLTPTTPAPTTDPTSPPPLVMDCDFQEGLCDWVQKTDDEFDWTRQKGGQVNEPSLGPLFDHTLKNDNGFYLIIKMSGESNGTAEIYSPLTIQTTDICIGFWYFMLGPSVGNLDLIFESKTEKSVAWTRKGTQTSEWLNAQVTISSSDISKVRFSGKSAKGDSGFIAIDDFRVTAGTCQETRACGFESPSLCGFESDVMDSFPWVHVSGSGGHTDHTYGTKLGHSMAALGANIQKPGVTKLLSAEYNPSTESCVQFWYLLSAGSSDSLSVNVLLNGEHGPSLWSGVHSERWQIAEITVSSPSNFRVAFKAEITPNPESFVLLDDISVKSGACFPTGSCDFESGMCTWMNAANGIVDDDDWIHADGHHHGPQVDFTTQATDGKFILISSEENGVKNSRSVLVSEWMKSSTDSCLEFGYHINGSHPGLLRLLLDTGASEKELLFETGETDKDWKSISINVTESKAFQIYLEAHAGAEGHIAVDDIRVKQGPCEDIGVESGVFPGCDFEADTCKWEDISVGQFIWERDRNGTITANTGPSVDHTTGTENGWYMTVEASRGDQNSYAAFQSPAMRNASNECLVEFYYHMFGEGIGDLKVFLQEGPRRTPLWWLSGNQEDDWHRAEIVVGRTHQVFTLLFEATRTYSELGDIAIDDISYLNCSLQEPQEVCPEGRFTCSNHVCVESNRECDYSDDCGDGSDEELCDIKGYLRRCSFEKGMCLWQECDSKSGWTLQRAEEAWPKRGPPRDHTLNIAAGHYITPAQNFSEIISSTLLPSSGCTIKFYYYSNENSSLLIRLRTLRNGDDDILLREMAVTQSFYWNRAEVTFTSSVKSKVIFQYVGSDTAQTAVDDISFSVSCAHDPENSELPLTPEPTTPTTSFTTFSTVNPCKESEFYCWRSDGGKCVTASAQCNYVLDCPLGEDEETCGPCNFENGLCEWSDASQGPNKWRWVKAPDNTGHYIETSLAEPSEFKAVFRSPLLPVSSAYCQLQFHFHISEGSSGDLTVLLQKGEDEGKHVWTRVNSTSGHWVTERLPLSQQDQPYQIVFSSKTTNSKEGSFAKYRTFALDDFSFHDCEKSYQPQDFAFASCSFEKDLCGWIQGAAEDLDWERLSGPTETSDTGPSEDHTSGKGYYLYIKSSDNKATAHLKSPLSPPSGPDGYCLTFWYHMFGATVGTLKMYLHDVSSNRITSMWQRRGSQENEWRIAQSRVNLQDVHQIIIEASSEGPAGQIAIDDISVTKGACVSPEGVCDFEEGRCGWTQKDDDLDWLWVSGQSQALPDHTTNTVNGHYALMETKSPHVPGQHAIMASPLLQAGAAKCLQLWYYMTGDETGTLNVYQEFSKKDRSLLVTQSGEQGGLWRFAQAPLTLSGSNYKIVVEGVTGQSGQGVIALDDVRFSKHTCSSSGHCDFEENICSWINMVEVDDTDWLRGQAGNAKHTGPSVDHTTNSSSGHYLYIHSSVGIWGDSAMMLSETFPPDSRGHCFTFWYHMYGDNMGTLNLYDNNRSIYNSGNRVGLIKWTESGNQGDVWRPGSIFVKHTEAFWFMFEFLKGAGTKGSVAVDDIHIVPGPCESDTTPPLPHNKDTVGVGIGVGVTLLVILSVSAALFLLRKKQCAVSESIIVHDVLNQNYSLFDCKGSTSTAENESSADFPGIVLSGDRNDSSAS